MAVSHILIGAPRDSVHTHDTAQEARDCQAEETEAAAAWAAEIAAERHAEMALESPFFYGPDLGYFDEDATEREMMEGLYA